MLNLIQDFYLCLCWELDVGTIEKIVHNIPSELHKKLVIFGARYVTHFEFLNLRQFWINWKKQNRVGPTHQSHGPNRGSPGHAECLLTVAAAALPALTASLPPFPPAVPAHRSRRHATIVHRLMRL
jgi:hypothetical protein